MKDYNLAWATTMLVKRKAEIKFKKALIERLEAEILEIELDMKTLKDMQNEEKNEKE